MIQSVVQLAHASLSFKRHLYGPSRFCRAHGHYQHRHRPRHSVCSAHTHPFNGFLSGTSRVSRYQVQVLYLDFTEARDSEWQCHQQGHTQVCTLLQTDNHASTPPLSFYRPDALPATQPTASKHWRQSAAISHIYATHAIGPEKG